jgi:hypothetical protein
MTFKVSFNGGDATSSGVLLVGEDSFKIERALTVLGTGDSAI